MINEKLLLKFLDRSIESEDNPERIKAYQVIRIFVLALTETENEQRDKVKDLFE